MEFGVARDISKQALYLDKQGERSELWRKQKVNNISCKFLANFTFRKAININQYIQLATRAPSTGRRIGDFHCNFSCQKFFLLPMVTKIVAAWSVALFAFIDCRKPCGSTLPSNKSGQTNEEKFRVMKFEAIRGRLEC